MTALLELAWEAATVLGAMAAMMLVGYGAIYGAALLWLRWFDRG